MHQALKMIHWCYEYRIHSKSKNINSKCMLNIFRVDSFQAIQQVTDLDLLSEHSQSTDNKNKNRYVNIVACK